MKPDIVFPTLTPKTDVVELLQKQRGVSNAAEALYKALVKARPRPDNFIPLGEEATLKAYSEHKDRLISAARIKQDADRTISNIYRQVGIGKPIDD